MESAQLYSAHFKKEAREGPYSYLLAAIKKVLW